MKMGFNEFWDSGTYKRLKGNPANKHSLHAAINNWGRKFPDLIKDLTIKEVKTKALIFTDVEKFIQLYNDTFGKKSSVPKKVGVEQEISGWTASSIDCFERKCSCEGCFYNFFPSLKGKCQMKLYVDEYFKKFGNPLGKELS